MLTIMLLIASNLFMNAAWYGHLKFKQASLLLVIVVSWLIALPEYALQVPANRWGHGTFSTPQLKIIQEVISISVFCLFSVIYLGERPTWNEGVALLLIVAAVAVLVLPKAVGSLGK